MESESTFNKTVDLGNIEDLHRFFGSFDENLRILENAFDISVAAFGSTVILTGKQADVSRGESVLENLKTLCREGFELSKREFQLAVQQVQDEHDPKMIARLMMAASTIQTPKRKVFPRTPMQKNYIDLIASRDLVFGIGPAGTGKTYLAVTMAVSYLMAKKVSRIILARPAVEAGESLGFLPGDMYEKVNPYLRPLYDALYDLLDVERANRMVEKGVIEIAPIAFMRGRTLNDSFIIMDEAQNSTSEQMKMFLTRLGFNTKTVVTGDISQIDLRGGRISGLVQVQSILRGVRGVEFVYFTHKDVVRCQLVRDIVVAYDRADV